MDEPEAVYVPAGEEIDELGAEKPADAEMEGVLDPETAGLLSDAFADWAAPSVE